MPAGSILVADDDTAIRTVLNQALSRAGYEVRLTGNAATLWRWVSQGDIILFATDPILDIDRHSPMANATSPNSNHFCSNELEATQIDSPTIPKTTRPIIMTVKDLLNTPYATITCPRIDADALVSINDNYVAGICVCIRKLTLDPIDFRSRCLTSTNTHQTMSALFNLMLPLQSIDHPVWDC